MSWSDEQRKKRMDEYLGWRFAVIDFSLEERLMFYMRQPGNLEDIYAVLENAYQDIGLDPQEARIPLHERDAFFENLNMSDSQKKHIVEENRKRAMRIFLAIRGKILDSDHRYGYYPEFVWDDELPPSKRRELAEKETKIMLWTGEWLKRYGVLEELYIWDCGFEPKTDLMHGYHGKIYPAKKYPHQRGVYTWAPPIRYCGRESLIVEG